MRAAARASITEAADAVRVTCKYRLLKEGLKERIAYLRVRKFCAGPDDDFVDIRPGACVGSPQTYSHGSSFPGPGSIRPKVR